MQKLVTTYYLGGKSWQRGKLSACPVPMSPDNLCLYFLGPSSGFWLIPDFLFHLIGSIVTIKYDRYGSKIILASLIQKFISQNITFENRLRLSIMRN